MEASPDTSDALLQQSPFAYPKKMDRDYLGLGYSIPSAPWLDVRVIYVRMSCCSLEDAPDTLAVRCAPCQAASSFEINGSRVPPADEAVLILRRDRVDTDSAEATYVSTDRLRTTGSVSFEVCDKDNTLICGALEKPDAWPDSQGLDRLGVLGAPSKSGKSGWVLECKCTISSPGCSFLKKNGDSSLLSPSMEVYIAGRFCGAPVILTQTVELLVRRKHTRRGALDSIPEADESDRANPTVSNLTNQMEELSFYQGLDDDNKRAVVPAMYGSGDYLEGEEGEITWFNAGVRVGVGLGLGMCVGIGIGVGLMMRAYQATTRTFRGRLL